MFIVAPIHYISLKCISSRKRPWEDKVTPADFPLADRPCSCLGLSAPPRAFSAI